MADSPQELLERKGGRWPHDQSGKYLGQQNLWPSYWDILERRGSVYLPNLLLNKLFSCFSEPIRDGRDGIMIESVWSEGLPSTNLVK